jgi:multicomponent Na+:H+ antiporter subunit E
MKGPDLRTLAGALASRGILFAALFWVIAEGQWAYPMAVALVAIAAAASSIALLPPPTTRLHIVGLLRFAPWFLLESVRGGTDVARRALSPDMRLATGFLEYRLQLESPAAHVFFANAVSLLPGTLSVALRGDVLRIHALDMRQPLLDRLRRLERRVEQVFA